MPVKDFTGQTINGWYFISRHNAARKNTPSTWNCRHHCGHEQVLRIVQARKSNTKLCRGCQFKKPLVEEIKEVRKTAKEMVALGVKTIIPKKIFYQNTDPDRDKTGEEDKKKRPTIKLTQQEIGKIAAYSHAGVPYRPNRG